MGASKIIRALPGFMRKSDADILFRGHAVFKDMRGNPAYAKPPVSLYDFAALLEAYTKALGAMIDGGRQATAERNRLRIEVILMLRRFGQYAEIACQNDMTTFLSSGFEPGQAVNRRPSRFLNLSSRISNRAISACCWFRSRRFTEKRLSTSCVSLPETGMTRRDPGPLWI